MSDSFATASPRVSGLADTLGDVAVLSFRFKPKVNIELAEGWVEEVGWQIGSKSLRWVLPCLLYFAILFFSLRRDRRAIFVRRVPWWDGRTGALC